MVRKLWTQPSTCAAAGSIAGAAISALLVLALSACVPRPELRSNTGRARNAILFVGDGMGVSTVTAARILDGQLRGEPGEENLLAFEGDGFDLNLKGEDTLIPVKAIALVVNGLAPQQPLNPRIKLLVLDSRNSHLCFPPVHPA